MVLGFRVHCKEKYSTEINYILVAGFICPQKVYTFSVLVGNITPKSGKGIHSATKISNNPQLKARCFGPGVVGQFRVEGWQCGIGV